MIEVALKILALFPFYLIGAFPTGRLIAARSGVQIEKIGSGNIGATNVARTLGKKAGILTLLGDIAKGLIGVLIARAVFSDPILVGWAAFVVVAGHCYSIPGRLKGGKGIATSLGTLFGLNWIIALVSLSMFIFVFTVTRIVSIASIMAALTTAIGFGVCSSCLPVVVQVALMAVLVIYRHGENVKRLIRGEEKRFSLGGTKTE